jgi:hypothetical protein
VAANYENATTESNPEMHTTNSRGGHRARAAWSRFVKLFSHEPAVVGLDATILEDRTLYSATPLLLADVDVNVHEDAPNSRLKLADLFGIDNQGGSVQYELIDNSDPALFDAVEIQSAADLVLNFGDNQHGTSHLTLRATDGSGNAEQLTLNVKVASANDTPTMKNLQNFTVTNAATGVTIIDLFAAFDDQEDADKDLTFQVVKNTNASLFASTRIDMDRGLLILRHAAGRGGSAELTVTATDTGGLSVGFETSPDFKVFDRIHGPSGAKPDFTGWGLDELTLMTHWYFFEYLSNGTYDFATLDVEKFTRELNAYSVDPTVPVVFDIENAYYDNTPEGRNRFAEVFALANQLRPDLDIGLYRFMPERNYHAPVSWSLAQQHAAMGIDTWFTARADQFKAAYEAWHDRSELYRTQPVGAAYGGEPLTDMIDTVNPSLYTFYRNWNTDPIWRPAALSSVTDRFTVDGPSFDTVSAVRVQLTAAAINSRLGLSESATYYVVNVQGNSFQLAMTPGGRPIDFAVDSVGDVFIGAKGPVWENLWHDPNVLNWKVYAEENIAEARKFDKPVYAWVSPSFEGRGVEFLEYDFFRWQLETLRPIADGVAIYLTTQQTPQQMEQQAWYAALGDFMHSLEQPAGKVTVSIPAGGTDGNRVPVAVGDELTTAEDQALTFDTAALLGNDQDLDGESLTAILANRPSHGTIQDRGDGSWVYTPNAGFHGTDSFQYQAFDGHDYSNVATVSIRVTDTNHPPVAKDDTVKAVEDQPLAIAISRLLSNDVDADGDTPQFQLEDGPQHGTLVRRANGTLVYRPDANFQGVDQFTYSLTDGSSSSAPATVTLNVASVNDRPVAVADRFSLPDGRVLTIDPQELLKNDRDADGDVLSVAIDQGPQHGQLTKLSDGRYQFVPNADFEGTDQFTYRISDGDQMSLPAVVTIGGGANGGALEARADSFGVIQNEYLVVRPEQLLANDSADRSSDVQIELVDAPTHGHVRWTLNGAIVYVPGKDYRGLDRFHYRITDGEHQSQVVAVNLQVKDQNDRPLGRPDVYRVVQGSVLRVNDGGVLENDRDPEGDALRASLLTAPRHGSLTLKRDGTFVYQPHAEFVGRDAFEYRVVDEHGTAAIARAVVRVTPLDPFSGQGPRLGESVTTYAASQPDRSETPVKQPLSEPIVLRPSAAGSALNAAPSSNPYAEILRELGMLAE